MVPFKFLVALARRLRVLGLFLKKLRHPAGFGSLERVGWAGNKIGILIFLDF